MRNTRTPTKNTNTDAVDTPTKTPKSVAKLKQFEYVTPKSMTKTKKIDDDQVGEEPKSNVKATEQSIASTSSENDDFQVDKSIPISPRDQKLLHKVYGDAWKTPDVIRSYSAVKGKPAARELTNTTPSILKTSRYSKGFDLFKQKLKTNLNSTRLEDHAEISIIETPHRVKGIKTPEKAMKPPQFTPKSKLKSTKKLPEVEASPSVVVKKKPSPKSNAAKIATQAQNVSSTSSRPQRRLMKRQLFKHRSIES